MKKQSKNRLSEASAKPTVKRLASLTVKCGSKLPREVKCSASYRAKRTSLPKATSRAKHTSRSA